MTPMRSCRGRRRPGTPRHVGGEGTVQRRDDVRRVTAAASGLPGHVGRARRGSGARAVTDSGELPARGVLDTSVVIALRDLRDPSALPAEPLITTVTLAELSAGPLVARDERERAARQAHLQQAEADFEPLPFDRASARAFGQVAASLRRSGRKTAARAYDALIAATAIANGLPVYTCNAAGFEEIDGLQVVPVVVPQRASG
jgi:tRNA(fMet)-specific endonuclease VapC